MATKRQTKEAATQWLEDHQDEIFALYGIADWDNEDIFSDHDPHSETVTGCMDITVDDATYKRLEQMQNMEEFFVNLAKRDDWADTDCEMSLQDNNRIHFEISRYYTP